MPEATVSTESLRDFLYPPGLRLEEIRIETETRRACLVCGQLIRSEGRNDPTVQVLCSQSEILGVACAACAREVLR